MRELLVVNITGTQTRAGNWDGYARVRVRVPIFVDSEDEGTTTVPFRSIRQSRITAMLARDF
jgi:hypothetical protein